MKGSGRPSRICVAESIRSAGLTPAQVAERIGLTDEELSESLSERRAFSTVELVQLAEVLDADANWLITGPARPDPHRLIFTARHDALGGVFPTYL